MAYSREKYLNKIADNDNFITIISEWKNNGDKIVFTNGCFDIIHLGHIDYLSKAAEMGDKLVIGLNTDSSVEKLKGKNRPIQDEKSRANILAAMEFIDLVIYFDEDTPYNLINELKPDVLVKGSDYKKEDIVGYDIVTKNGGKVQTINFLPGYSTSLIEKKILENN